MMSRRRSRTRGVFSGDCTGTLKTRFATSVPNCGNLSEIWSRRYQTPAQLPGRVHQTFTEPVRFIRGASGDVYHAAPGQVVTMRHFYLKVGQEPLFERLWNQSALAESTAPDCLYKRLDRDLNLPTYYVSYSLWNDPAAPVAAANQHSHWQADHEPYPLASAVIREMLAVVAIG